MIVYTIQNLDDQNIVDVCDNLDDNALVGIVDEQIGGIVAYAFPGTAEIIINALNGESK